MGLVNISVKLLMKPEILSQGKAKKKLVWITLKYLFFLLGKEMVQLTNAMLNIV